MNVLDANARFRSSRRISSYHVCTSMLYVAHTNLLRQVPSEHRYVTCTVLCASDDDLNSLLCFPHHVTAAKGAYPVGLQKEPTNLTSAKINPLTPNDPPRGRTAPLTSKRCILYIYSTNIGTEYFKHDIYSTFFSLQNAVCFIILTYLVLVLFTFYIQVC